MTRFRIAVLLALLGLALAPVAARADHGGGTFLGRFHTLSQVASTVPGNGDVNPYGVAVVPRSIGKEIRGNVLVSNFNNSSNLQGTGTTIVQVSPGGTATLFAQINPSSVTCPGGVGLTTALAILSGGWVVVGSLPTTDGMPDTIGAGCLIVLDKYGNVAETFHGGNINGPWDMTATGSDENATLYFTNVLNGTVAGGGNEVDQGTVVRMRLMLPENRAPRMVNSTVIGSGFPEKTDPSALVIGPTGLALSSGEGDHEGDNARNDEDGGDNGGTLFVADSVGNRIAAIPHPSTRTSSAGTGMTVTSGGFLNDPLGMALAPNGNIITANGDDGLLVETTPRGSQVAHFDTGLGGGSLFGIAVKPGGNGLYLVDDGSNHLDLLS
jgi:hypothetical protein